MDAKTYDVPEIVKDDARLGKRARTSDGFEGVVWLILRFSDGLETFEIHSESGSGYGGIRADQLTFIE